MPESKAKIIKVTLTQEYYIEMYDDKKTKINGWTMEEVIKDWFVNHPLNSPHVSRDSHKVGYGKKFIKAEVEVI